jgi:methionine-rich copper-binding protein CopC
MEEKAAMEKTGGAMMAKLPDQQFAAHFVDSTPKHGATFAQTPDKVVINFNFTLSEASTITFSKEGAPVVSAKPTFSGNKLTMSAPLPANVGNGLYQVDYRACWPDQSCHTGKFAFIVGS